MQPPSFENQLELPVVELVGEEAIRFPRLDMDDLIKWAGDAKQSRIRATEQRYRSKQPPIPEEVIQRLLQPLHDQGFELGNLLAKVYEPEGTRKVLIASLRKAGLSDEQALATLKRIHFKRQLTVALAVMDPPPPPDPATQQAQGGEADFTEPATGDSPSP